MKLEEIRVMKFNNGNRIVDLFMTNGNERVYATTDKELNITNTWCIENGSFSPLNKEVVNKIKTFVKTLEPFKVLNNEYEGVKFKSKQLG